jgi:hypothetical protein
MTAHPHTHVDEMRLQPLPECLAPSPEQRARLEADDIPVPQVGEPVVFEEGRVSFLIPDDPARPMEKHNTLLICVGRRGEGCCEGADWDHFETVNPWDLEMEESSVISVGRARLLFLRHAKNAAVTETES